MPSPTGSPQYRTYVAQASRVATSATASPESQTRKSNKKQEKPAAPKQGGLSRGKSHRTTVPENDSHKKCEILWDHDEHGVPRVEKCPLCPAYVRPSRLRAHIGKVHGPAHTSILVRPAKAPKLILEKDAPKLIGVNIADDILAADNLKREICESRIQGLSTAHCYRDNGRFGSAPDYDTMDDE